MDDEIRLVLFGSPALYLGNGLGQITAKRPLAILSLIYLSGSGRVPREFVAGTIWSDVDEKQSKGSLRTTLYEMRLAYSGLDKILTIERSTIALDKRKVRCDLTDILEAAESGDVSPLEKLPEHFDTQILYGFEDVSDGFCDWLNGMRTQTRRSLVARLEQDLECHTLLPERRVAIARCLASLEPMSERACRAAMLAMSNSGDTGQALLFYQQFYNRLDDELGMEPSEKTQDLYVEIKQGFHEPSTPFKGRASAVDHLAEVKQDLFGRPVLAVLPMMDLGPEKNPPGLSERLVEDLIERIAHFRELPVLSNATTVRMSADADESRSLRDRYGAEYALQCSIRRHGNTCRIKAQLLRTDTGLVEWVQSFDASHDELMSLETQVANQVVARLLPTVEASELRKAKAIGEATLGAYHLLLRARQAIYGLERTQISKAQDVLCECLSIAPEFTQAYLTMADLHSVRLGQGWSNDPEREQLELDHCLSQALKTSPGNARARAMLGHNVGAYGRRFGQAVALFDRAIDTMPNDAETLLWCTPVFAYLGEGEKALTLAKRALALSPDDPLEFRYLHFLSIAYYACGENDAAAEMGLRSRAINPRYSSNLRITIAALVRLGRLGEAQVLSQEVRENDPAFKISRDIECRTFRDDARRYEFYDLLRAAGLPE